MNEIIETTFEDPDTGNNMLLEKSIERFEEIVINIVNNASALKEYDYFGSAAILSAVQLMLSKSPDFVNQMEQSIGCQTCRCGNNGDMPLETPKDVKDDVDNIIKTIRQQMGK